MVLIFLFFMTIFVEISSNGLLIELILMDTNSNREKKGQPH
ncbi:MAG: hypothetical protein RIR11_1922 [Bacteroidota bacterium]|jgi:hypothetical protein